MYLVKKGDYTEIEVAEFPNMIVERCACTMDNVSIVWSQLFSMGVLMYLMVLNNTSSTFYLNRHLLGVSHTHTAGSLAAIELLPQALLYILYIFVKRSFFFFIRICVSCVESEAIIQILSDVLYFQAVHNMDEFMFGK